MTNEEKALELFPDTPTLECLCKGVREKLIEMAEWKDREWEEKIREWLSFNTNWNSEYDEEGRNPDYGKIDEMFSEIKNGLI